MMASPANNVATSRKPMLPSTRSGIAAHLPTSVPQAFTSSTLGTFENVVCIMFRPPPSLTVSSEPMPSMSSVISVPPSIAVLESVATAKPNGQREICPTTSLDVLLPILLAAVVDLELVPGPVLFEPTVLLSPIRLQAARIPFLFLLEKLMLFASSLPKFKWLLWILRRV